MAGWARRLAAAFGPARFDGTAGRPPSGNGASSFHLWWNAPPGEWHAVEATLTVDAAPAVPELYFWALQASFTAHGRPGGAGHLGLQWCPPNRTCVNWGGYDAEGAILDGSGSALPSDDGNPHTRSYPWRAGVGYRLRIERGERLGGGDPRRTWRGSVTDTSTGTVTAVRDLFAMGESLDGFIVWSEVFARCDDPPVTVRWGDFVLVGADGTTVPVGSVDVNYQAVADGGCATTDSSVEGDRFVQRTSVPRRTPQGSNLAL